MADANRAVFTDDTIYPPSKSMAGTNAYYMDYCTTGEQRPGYAVCLHKIKAFEEGRMRDQLGACAGAIQWKTCPAMGLRDKEALEGRALFYLDREKLREWHTAQMKMPVTSGFLDELKAAGKPARDAREAARVTAREAAGKNPPWSTTPLTKPAPKPAPIIGSTDGYAAAINAALKETAALAPAPAPKAVAPQPAAPVKPVSLKPAPGETMLEFAKRMRAERAAV